MAPLSSRLSGCRTMAARYTLLLAVGAAVSTASPTADKPLRESTAFFHSNKIHQPAPGRWCSEVALEIGNWPTAAAAGCARLSGAGTSGGSAHRVGKSDTAASTSTVCCGSGHGEEGQQIDGHMRAVRDVRCLPIAAAPSVPRVHEPDADLRAVPRHPHPLAGAGAGDREVRAGAANREAGSGGRDGDQDGGARGGRRAAGD